MNLAIYCPAGMLPRALAFSFLLLIASAALIPSVAHAQAAQCQVSGQCDQGQAYVAAIALANSEGTRICKMVGGNNATYTGPRVTLITTGTYQAGVNCSAGGNTSNAGHTYFSGLCSGRPQGQAGMINGTLYGGGVCDTGCKVTPNLDPATNFSLKEQGNPNAISIRAGTWKPTGETCSPDAEQKPPKKDEFCHVTGSGHTVCKSKDKTCVASASGFRTCASDTGNQKGHTQTNNQRTEAAAIGSPNTPPNPPSNRPGENWQQSGSGSSITNNNTNTTNNINNYTNQGTPNGNQPVPGDGSGPGQGGSNGGADGDGGGEGEGKPDYGSVGGDGQCKGSFTCTGGDPVLCAIARQTYLARCEADGRFGEGEGAGSFPGDGDGGAGEDPDPAKTITSATPSLNVIDKNGFFGGGSCPAFEVASTKYGAFTFADSSFCEVLPVARACFLFFGAFMALGILMGWGTKD